MRTTTENRGVCLEILLRSNSSHGSSSEENTKDQVSAINWLPFLPSLKHKGPRHAANPPPWYITTYINSYG